MFRHSEINRETDVHERRSLILCSIVAEYCECTQLVFLPLLKNARGEVDEGDMCGTRQKCEVQLYVVDIHSFVMYCLDTTSMRTVRRWCCRGCVRLDLFCAPASVCFPVCGDGS